MKIKVKDDWAVIVQDDTLRQNSEKRYLAEFDFDRSWDGYARTVVFEAGPASVVVVLKEYSEAENFCPIPKECLKYGGIKLKIGIYGVKGEKRKAIVGYLTSTVIADTGLTGSTRPADRYSEIMAVIGDLSGAGFEGMTLAEALREIQNSVCETATDAEVDDALNEIFSEESAGPVDRTNTATDEEVSSILDEVFGKQP